VMDQKTLDSYRAKETETEAAVSVPDPVVLEPADKVRIDIRRLKDVFEDAETDAQRKEITEAMLRKSRLLFGQPAAVTRGGVERAEKIAPKVGRNDPCACGSGKKFKRCCLRWLGRV